MSIYALLQEMIDYPSRCVFVILVNQLFFNIATLPMLIQDIKNNTPDTVLSMISYCTTFGLNLLLTIQIICIVDDINTIPRILASFVSFGICAINVWLMVKAGYKERRK